MRIPFPRTFSEVLVGLITFGAIVGGGFYLRHHAQLEAGKAMCNANMFQIMTAMLRYQAEFGKLPPASVKDVEGRPLHSWRVLLLRYLDPNLYAAYDFNEPWNGPRNRQLSDRISRYYRCPSDVNGHGAWTSYVVIVGQGTAFPPDESTSLNELPDGAANTIIIAETASSGIDWLEPRDLDFTSMSFGVNSGALPSISSNDLLGPVVAFANGKIWRLIPKNVVPETLQALVTRQGGEPIDKEALIQTHTLAY